MKSENEIAEIFNTLINMPIETEWVEFKEAKSIFNTDTLGKYFSAISNEAYLKNKDRGWIVFGVTDKVPRKICGTSFRDSPISLSTLKREIALKTSRNISFAEIYEHYVLDDLGVSKRVLIFEIYPCSPGLPVSYDSEYWGRNGESLTLLSPPEKEEIILKGKYSNYDWSQQCCEVANINNLEVKSIDYFRSLIELEFFRPNNYEIINNLSNFELLESFGLLIKEGDEYKITNACLLLFGEKNACLRLLGDQCWIQWVYDVGDITLEGRPSKDIFPPFIYAFQEINKLIESKNDILAETGLFKREQKQYETRTIRELSVNSFAHRDWEYNSPIQITQSKNYLKFENPGEYKFIDLVQLSQDWVSGKFYRNGLLSRFLQSINLMDKQGSGIIKWILKLQQIKGLPVPTYSKTDRQGWTIAKIQSKVIDINFAKLVMIKSDMEIQDLILLDKIAQGENKVGEQITESDVSRLKNLGYIEIRSNRWHKKCYISANFSEKIGLGHKYVKHKGLENSYYEKLIIKYLSLNESQKTGRSRAEIFELLKDKFSDEMDSKQKDFKITNLLTKIKKSGTIKRVGELKNARWFLNKK